MFAKATKNWINRVAPLHPSERPLNQYRKAYALQLSSITKNRRGFCRKIISGLMPGQREDAPELILRRNDRLGSQWVLMATNEYSWVLKGTQWVLGGYSDCVFLGSQARTPPLCLGNLAVV